MVATSAPTCINPAVKGTGVEPRDMSETDRGPRPVVKRAEEIDYQPVGAADGLSKGVLLDESDGAPTFAMRRFTLAPGATAPKHTNEVEHEQYVLAGEYTVGVGDEEYTVSAGDSLLVPAGVVHWYRNEGDEEGAFVCCVPNGDDAIQVVDE